MASTGPQVTQLLNAWSEGDQAALVNEAYLQLAILPGRSGNDLIAIDDALQTLAAFDARQKSWLRRELSMEPHGS
jgi:hypothetical protein